MPKEKETNSWLRKLAAIYSGWRNDFLRDDVEVEKLASERAEVCAECPHIDLTGDKCSIVKKLKLDPPCCSLCGCPLSKKVRQDWTKCPDNRWKE